MRTTGIGDFLKRVAGSIAPRTQHSRRDLSSWDRSISSGVGTIGLSAGGRLSAGGPTVSVETEYLGTLEAQLEPAQAVGSRLILNVPGGTIQGPKIDGTIVQPAADWLMPMPDGSLRLDVRTTIKTSDGEFILVEYNGVIVPSKEVSDRLSKGEVITAKDEYFLTAPRFTTASENYDWLNYDWLNKVQAVGKMVTLSQKGIKYDLFIVR